MHAKDELVKVGVVIGRLWTVDVWQVGLHMPETASAPKGAFSAYAK